VFEVGEASQPRYIINFPTKRRWRSATRLQDIDAGLTALVQEVRRLEIRSIAVPALGCGNGGLDWSDVFPHIKGVLGMLQEVKVLVYQPRGPL
jgi:O-acetyl-ADP-ribose deacetylase (regulator of RNase III)